MEAAAMIEYLEIEDFGSERIVGKKRGRNFPDYPLSQEKKLRTFHISLRKSPRDLRLQKGGFFLAMVLCLIRFFSDITKILTSDVVSVLFPDPNFLRRMVKDTFIDPYFDPKTFILNG